MKSIFLSIVAVGTALALAAPVWAGGEVLSDGELAGIEAAGLEIENSCALCYQVNKELDVDVDVDISKSFNKLYASKKSYSSSKTYTKTVNADGDWRDMYFKNGILIGGDVKNNNAVNFIMANGNNSIAAQNNFLMLKADGTGLGAHAKGVNQINNAFGYTNVDQSHKVYVKKFHLDVDVDNSFNKDISKSYSSSKSFSYKSYKDIDVDIYKKSVYVVK